MMFMLVWLCISYGFTFALGMVCVEANHIALSFLFFLGVPALRIYRRFQAGRGYYLIGYEGEAGNIPNLSGRVTYQERPVRFKICLLLEVLLIGFLGFMLLVRRFSLPY